MAKGKTMQAVVDMAGNIDPSLGKAVDQAVGLLEKINWKAVAVAGAVGGIAVATGKALLDGGKYLKDLGGEFDNISDTIRAGTGATGEALEALNADFDEVYKSVPTSMEDAGTAITDYNKRLDLAGPALQRISKQALQVSDLLGDDLTGVIEGSSQAFQQWDLDADQMSDAMDYAFKVSQRTGAGFTGLMDKMQFFGPQLQEMGYSFETAAALMGQMEKAGVNTEEVLAAMKKGVNALAKEGISATDGLAMYYEEILNAGDAAKATAIASEIFGARAGSTMAAAIRDGTLAVGDLTTELLENGETIAGAAEDTYDFQESLQMMKNKIDVALQPTANTIFETLNKFMPPLQKLIERLAPLIEDLVERATPFVEEFLGGMADLLEELVPMIADLAAELLPLILDLISQLLPPLLDLFKALLPPLIEIMKVVLPPIVQLFSQLLPILTEIISAVLPPLIEIISVLFKALEPILDILMDLLIDVILPLIQPLLDIVMVILEPILALLEPILSLLKPIFDILTPILKLLEPLLSLLKPLADVIGFIVGLFAKLVEWVVGGLSWLFKMIFGGGADEAAADAGDKMGGYATGGFTSGMSIAGEDPRYPVEAIISFNPAYRKQNLSYWARAGQMLGVADYDDLDILSSSSSTVIYDLSGLKFAPQIIAREGENFEDLIRQIKEYEPEFVDFILEAMVRREAGRYAPAGRRVL